MSDMAINSVVVIHGPNLNLLGEREPKHYGNSTLDEINSKIQAEALQSNISVETFQSNSEADILNKIHSIKADFIIINPAAFTHTSVSIHDALAATKILFIEVHLSNVFARESFRKESFFSDIAVGVISGFGAEGYLAALRYAAQQK